MQNQCISGVPQGIPMQFFAQVMLFEQFHTYSQWFAAKFNFLNISIAGKCSKCLN